MHLKALKEIGIVKSFHELWDDEALMLVTIESLWQDAEQEARKAKERQRGSKR